VIRRHGWVWIALYGACAMPELDTQGTIRCGVEGLCPQGYQCRLDRCCPAGAALTACPMLPPGIAGAPCTGTTCTVAVGARSVAGVCMPPPNFPGGYCTVTRCDPNDSAGSCGDFAVCVPVNDSAYCVRRCVFDPLRPQPQPCRNLPGETPDGDTAYVCIKDPYDRTANAGLCVPDCTRTNMCGTNSTCEASTRRCVPRDCRHVPNVCEPMGLSCNRNTGQCIRCEILDSTECTRAEPLCGMTPLGNCRQRCTNNMPCLSGLRCVAGYCIR